MGLDHALEQERQARPGEPGFEDEPVLHQGDFIVPIAGARKIRHLEDTAAAADIVLSADELALIEEASPQAAVAGARYAKAELELVGG